MYFEIPTFAKPQNVTSNPKMKHILILFTFIIANSIQSQTDTVDHKNIGYHTGGVRQTTIERTTIKDNGKVKYTKKTRKKKYELDGKQVSEKQYYKVVDTLQSDKINNCRPCWLRYYTSDGKLLQEGLSYTDCALGKRTEYYKSGKIKVIRFYKTNETNDWTFGTFPCSVADGIWTFYREDGSIEKTETYKDGKKVE